MEIALEILAALVLIAAGYVAACKLLECDLRPTKDLIIFFAIEVLAEAILIILFNVEYTLSLREGIRLIVLSAILFPIGLIDYKKMIIPNELLIAGLAIRVVLLGWSFIDDVPKAVNELKDCAIAAVIISLAFLLIHLVFKNSIGAGDIKLFFVIGFYEGLQATFGALFFSLIASFVVAVFLLITKKKKKTDVIPFGPCILIGTVLSIAMTGM